MPTNHVEMPLRAKRTGRLLATVTAAAFVIAPLGLASTAHAAPAPFDSGFNPTNAGVVKYIPYAPRESAKSQQINAPLRTQKKADRLAATFGFRKGKTFDAKQLRQYLAGKGTIPEGYTKAEAQKAAQLTRLAVTYLTNTTGNTYTRVIDGEKVTVNLGSYGLIVDRQGMLRVPANCPDPDSSDFSLCSPVRLINWVLAPDAICDDPDLGKTPPAGIPCGYMGAWMRANGAKDTLKELYTSAYVREAQYAATSQEEAAGPDDKDLQLIYITRADGTSATVGVPVAPAMWITNYLLVYALSPKMARDFPAYWTAIPERVVTAIEQSDNGQVSYSEYMSELAR